MKLVKKKKFFFLASFFILVILLLVFFSFKPLPIFKKEPINYLSAKRNQNPAKNSAYKFSFIVTGDNHKRIKVYSKLIKKINQENYSFLIDLGDIVDWGKEKEYQKVQENLKDLKIPVYHIIGNHDIYGQGGKFWEKYFGQRYYSWDYQNVHFVVLDNVWDKNGYWDKELSWLEKDLSATDKKFKFIFMHAPPLYPRYLQEKAGFDVYVGFRGPVSKKKIKPLLTIAQKYKVDNIYTGHSHIFSEYNLSGVSITTIPSLGGKIYSHYDLFSRYSNIRPEYLKIDVFEDYYQEELVALEEE